MHAVAHRAQPLGGDAAGVHEHDEAWAGARAMAQAGATAESLLSGVRMTYDLFLSELRKFGLEQLPAQGGTFDPSLHEAIASVPSSGKPGGAILAEARKGYLLNGRLLRPAQLVIGGDRPGRDAHVLLHP